MKYILGICLFLISFFVKTTNAQTDFSKYQKLLREVYQELIEINTTASEGNTTLAAEAMKKRLISAGYREEDVEVLGQYPNKGNLVARLHGTGEQKPLLLLAHLDVVEAKKEDWSFDPFKLTEKDGYFYGRGTIDDKAMAAIYVTNLILYKQERFIPDRDLIVCLTADEETGEFDGIQWLLKYHRNMIDAPFCLTEGGLGIIENGKYILNQVELSEKIYQSYRLEVTNPGGHSSLPTKDNAIYHLAYGIIRISKYEFPVSLNEGTRIYFEKMSTIKTGKIAEDMKAVTAFPADTSAINYLSRIPIYNSTMRTTCVATMLKAGQAENALPQRASAIINCRILPWESPEKVLQKLNEVVADDNIKITPIWEEFPSPPSPIIPEIFNKIEKVSNQLWPGIPVIPIMNPGATDGMYLRNAGVTVYGISGLFVDVSENREHGKDERVGVNELYGSQYFLYLLVKELSSGK